jgi:hypothetical protein
MKKIIPLILAVLLAAPAALAQEEPRPNVTLDILERTYPREFGMIQDRDFRIVSLLIRIEHRIKNAHLSVSGSKFVAQDQEGNMVRSRGSSTMKPALKAIMLAPNSEVEGWISFKVPAGEDFGVYDIMFRSGKENFSRWVDVP